MSRILALSYRIFRQFARDRRTLVLMFLVPVLIMSLFTWLLRAKPEPFRAAIVVPEKSGEMVGDLLRELLIKNGRVIIVPGFSEKGIDAALKDGRIQAAIVLKDADFEQMQAGKRARLEVALEGSEPMSSRDFLSQLQQVQKPLLDTLRGLVALSDENVQLIAPPEIELRFLYGGPDFGEADYFAPPTICFMAFFFVFIVTGVSFLRERSQGTMERLLASPLSQFEIIVGYLFGFLPFALAQTGVILFFVFYILNIHYLGHLASVLAVEFLVVLIASNMGIFFSSFAKNELQMIQFIPLMVLPQVLLSGMLWSVESMPKALQYLAYILPLTYANLALRNLMIKGFSFAQILPEVGALLVFALLMAAAGILTIRKFGALD